MHTVGRKSLDRVNGGPISGGKRNWCVMFPENVSLVAEAPKRRNPDW